MFNFVLIKNGLPVEKPSIFIHIYLKIRLGFVSVLKQERLKQTPLLFKTVIWDSLSHNVNLGLGLI